MTTKAKAIQTLYRAGRITKEGVKQAVDNGIITKADYFTITGEGYPEPVIPEVIPEETTESIPNEVFDTTSETIPDVEQEMVPETIPEEQEKIIEVVEETTEEEITE